MLGKILLVYIFIFWFSDRKQEDEKFRNE